jgi:hypothetical protein
LWTNTPFWKIIGFSGKIDGYRCEEILNDYTLFFFDKYLKGKDKDIKGLAQKYPCVISKNPE